MKTTALIARHIDKSETPTREGCHIIECWNDGRDPEASIARARVPPGATTELHALRGIAERQIVVEGVGRVELEGMSGGHEVGPGDVVVIPGGVRQRCNTQIAPASPRACLHGLGV